MQKGRVCAFYTLYSTLNKSQVFTILYANESALMSYYAYWQINTHQNPFRMSFNIHIARREWKNTHTEREREMLSTTMMMMMIEKVNVNTFWKMNEWTVFIMHYIELTMKTESMLIKFHWLSLFTIHNMLCVCMFDDQFS